MGGNESTPTKLSEDSYIDNYEIMKYDLIRVEHDRRFGEVEIRRNKHDGTFIWLKTLRIEDDTTAQRIKDHISTREYLSDCFITLHSRLSLK